jgi:hypothetical protein
MPMRKPLALFSLIALTPVALRPTRRVTSASADSAAHSPNISVSAAPGWPSTTYAFRLPSARIAAVQEQHAQTCERLGLARCRITGARYRVTGAQEIDAMLAFKLDPAIARQFGKTGVETVGRAEGMLVDAEITGTEVAVAAPASERRALLATTPMVFNYGSGELIPASTDIAQSGRLSRGRAPTSSPGSRR